MRRSSGGAEDFPMQIESPTIGNAPPLVPEQTRQRRADILSDLRQKPASSALVAYIERLKIGSEKQDKVTFAEGLTLFANVCGTERDKYFDSALIGPHYPDSWTKIWNRTYPDLAFSLNDRFSRLQCPPSWSYELVEPKSRMVLTYHGEAPFTEGLIEFLLSPITLDCGMWSATAFWLATLYTFGSREVLSSFRFGKGQFKLTQECYCPMNEEGTDGNLLFPFYDHPSLHRRMTDLPESRTRIQIKAIFNNLKYTSKHPAGHMRLLNVIQIGDSYITFNPEASQTTFSLEELQQIMLEAYKRPRDDFDYEMIRFWERHPENEHPDFAPKTFGALAEEARQFSNRTPGETEWTISPNENHGCSLTFNFDRLFKCFEETENAHLIGDSEDVLSKAANQRKQAIASHLLAEMELALSGFDKHDGVLVCEEHKCSVDDLCEHLSHFHDYDIEVIEAILLLIK